jgi:hypothetical protein
MEYTLEQKALAAIRGDLWWRFPDGVAPLHEWSRVSEDFCPVSEAELTHTQAMYHIGPSAPPILSELEAELLAVLVAVDGYLAQECFHSDWTPRQLMQSAIKKARGEA